jgi:GH3 auxin-responsive promoter
MEACQEAGAIIHEYTAAPVYMDKNAKGKHEWLIEFEKAPDSLDLFTEKLDSSLKKLNSDYEAKRYNDITLARPLLKVLPKGAFYRWFALKGKLGGQNKMPRLSNDRRYVDELLALCVEI